MKLSTAQIMAHDLMNLHGVGHWTFKFDRAIRRAGLTSYSQKTISLSRPLTLNLSEMEVRDTLLHEIAHAMIGPGYGHGATWRRQALAIGCKATRCISLTDAQRVKAPLVIFCLPGQHIVKEAHRRSNISGKWCRRHGKSLSGVSVEFRANTP